MSDLKTRFRRYIEQEQQLPKVFRRNPEGIARKEREWEELEEMALKAEGGRIWRRPIRQR